MLILAGDIGGTSTRLAYFDAADEKPKLLAMERFPSRRQHLYGYTINVRRGLSKAAYQRPGMMRQRTTET